MSRHITMGGTGNFLVSDDPHGVIATALLIATAPQNILEVDRALAPNGRGFSFDTFGMIYRVEDRDDLEPPYDEDESINPASQELWMLMKESDRKHPITEHVLITGDELRSLVREAIRLRTTAKSHP